MPGSALQGFRPAALRVSARDRWMAWSEEQRRAHLNQVVCLNRFLIRPSVRCPHLVSHVLGRILRRLPLDFETHCGFRPWLVESFADAGYDGTWPARGPTSCASARPRAVAARTGRSGAGRR